MDVDTTETGRFQDGFGEDQSIGDDHGDVQFQVLEDTPILVRFQAPWRENGQTQFQRAGVNGSRPSPATASGRSWRLSIDAGNIMTRVGQRRSRRGRKNPDCP